MLGLIVFSCSLLQLPVPAQGVPSYGLGHSDAEWKYTLGKPTPSGRDEWVYRNGHLQTRSWARKDAPRGRDWNGYVEENYLVKEITILWSRKRPVSFATARGETAKLLPTDAKPISRFRRTRGKSYRYYSSSFLTTRLFPGLAGDDYCVTPWGYGVGKFKIEYWFARGRVWQVTIDVGEPHQTSLDTCKGS
jgi:hypothetical protein